MLPTPIVHADYEKVYEPFEDSFLLLDCLEEEKNFIIANYAKLKQIPLIVEIGSGSGIVSTFLAKNILPRSISISTDLNPHACKTSLQTAKENECINVYDSIQSDLTTSILPNQIDILIFNPPYVPSEEVPEIPRDNDAYEWLDLALIGGPDGMVVTNRLLDNLDSVLSPNGIAYILFCARNKPEQVVEKMSKKGWKMDLIINRKAGWEVLSVYKFTKY